MPKRGIELWAEMTNVCTLFVLPQKNHEAAKKKYLYSEQTKVRLISHREGGAHMADRQQFLRVAQPDPELLEVLEASRDIAVTEEELHEQRISFAFGNAPMHSEDRITKDSVRLASENIRLLP